MPGDHLRLQRVAGSERPPLAPGPLLLGAEAAGKLLTRQVDLEHSVPCPPAMELEELQQLLEPLARGWEQWLECGLGRGRLEAPKPQQMLDHRLFWDPCGLKATAQTRMGRTSKIAACAPGTEHQRLQPRQDLPRPSTTSQRSPLALYLISTRKNPVQK